MSAYIVNRKHINTLVNWAIQEGVYLPFKGGKYHQVNHLNAQNIVDILTKANVDSVNARYSESSKLKYKFESFMVTDSPKQIINYCSCLDYQSCETEIWNHSLAKAILSKIEITAYACEFKAEFPHDLNWECPE